MLPVDLKETQFTPLFKKGEHDIPGNYRPVSLTSVVRKVQKSIETKRVIGQIIYSLATSTALCRVPHEPHRCCLR